MVYESDDFYDLCDRAGHSRLAGLHVRQHGLSRRRRGVRRQRRRRGASSCSRACRRAPSLAVLCGNSEGEQQAAMWGAPRERWSPRLFHESLPALRARALPATSRTGRRARTAARFRISANAGTTSYYGVGAYLRPLEDARRAEVRFATRVPAFANVPRRTARCPAASTCACITPRGRRARRATSAPAGTSTTCAITTSSGSSASIRSQLRYADHDRYLELGRVVTGEVMAQVFGEWRRARSTCAAALVWFLRDLWPGAGWGVVDATGAPKAAWYYLSARLQPVAVHVSDEGGNGLALHVCNDGAEPLRGRARADAVPRRRDPGRPGRAAGRRGAARRPGAARGGRVRRLPRSSATPTASVRRLTIVLVATLRTGTAGGDASRRRSTSPGGCRRRASSTSDSPPRSPRTTAARVSSFERAGSPSQIAIEAAGFEPEDAFFHLAPGGERSVRLRRVSGTDPARGTVQPLNAETPTRFVSQGPRLPS